MKATSTRRLCISSATVVVSLGLMALVRFDPGLESPVADAAMRGEVETIRLLLTQGADVNAAQGDGMTALHWAARRGEVEVAKILVEAGASLESRTRVGAYTPLLVAARSGNGPVLASLLEAGSDPGLTTRTGVTALHLAAAAGDLEATAALIDFGAQVDALETSSGQTPLMFAASAGRNRVIQALLQHGAQVGLSSQVVDIPALESEDRELRTLRSEQLAALKAAEGEGKEEGGEPESAQEDEETGQAGEAEGAEDEEPPETEESTEKPLSYGELVGGHGGFTALLHAVRQGYTEAALALLDGGADVNQVSEGDHTSPLLIATINGHFDLGLVLLGHGADPNLASDAGAAPLYAALNVQWAPKALYPQPKAHEQQSVGTLEYMERLLEAGSDPNVRLSKHLWYMSYNFDLLGVNTKGATPFWRAAYGTDVPAMRLLLAHGADPDMATENAPTRRRRGDPNQDEDKSGLPPIPMGGAAIYPIHAASGVGYGKGYAANSHRHAPDGWVPSIKFLLEELGADVNQRDHEGYTPLHHAASRGDVQLIEYLVSMGADVTLVSRAGQTTADMANGPVQRIQPFPEALALLESLGAINNQNCVSC